MILVSGQYDGCHRMAIFKKKGPGSKTDENQLSQHRKVGVAGIGASGAPGIDFFLGPERRKKLALLIFGMQVFLPGGAPGRRLVLSFTIQIMFGGFQMHQRPFQIIYPVELLDLGVQGIIMMIHG